MLHASKGNKFVINCHIRTLLSYSLSFRHVKLSNIKTFTFPIETKFVFLFIHSETCRSAHHD